MNTGALLPVRGAGTSLTTVMHERATAPVLMESRMRRDSQVRFGGQTTGRKAGIGVSLLTLRAASGRQVARNGTGCGSLTGCGDESRSSRA